MAKEEFPNSLNREVDQFIAGLGELDRELTKNAVARRNKEKAADRSTATKAGQETIAMMEKEGWEFIYDGPESIEGNMTFPPSVKLQVLILGKRKLIFKKEVE